MEKMYPIDELYLGTVSYTKRNKSVTRVHTLIKSAYEDEMLDLDLCRMVNEEVTDSEEVYFKKTLIPFSDMLASRINWGAVSREDAIELGYYLFDKYLKILSIKRVSLIRSKK